MKCVVLAASQAEVCSTDFEPKLQAAKAFGFKLDSGGRRPQQTSASACSLSPDNVQSGKRGSAWRTVERGLRCLLGVHFRLLLQVCGLFCLGASCARSDTGRLARDQSCFG